MDRGRMSAETVEKLRRAAGKYKYAVAVGLLGVLLMLLPSGGSRSPRAAPDAPEGRADVRAEMEAALSAFDGVGRLRLVLTGDAESGRWTGALVVCEGGDGAAVRLRLTQALTALTGLPSDKIAIVRGRP